MHGFFGGLVLQSVECFPNGKSQRLCKSRNQNAYSGGVYGKETFTDTDTVIRLRYVLRFFTVETCYVMMYEWYECMYVSQPCYNVKLCFLHVELNVTWSYMFHNRICWSSGVWYDVMWIFFCTWSPRSTITIDSKTGHHPAMESSSEIWWE